MGLWALTFPIGVFATATNILAIELDSPAFRVIGAVLSAQVVVNWVYVAGCTVWGVGTGMVFKAPELMAGGGGEVQVELRFGSGSGRGNGRGDVEKQ